MNPVLRLLGRILNLVGISSPEDAARRKAAAPSWKTTSAPEKSGENASEKKP